MESNHISIPPKPVTELWRPELVRLPKLTLARRIFRICMQRVMKIILWLLVRVEVRGMENFPKQGPALVVINHLGDADAAVLLAVAPYAGDAIGKIELYDLPILGKLLDLYGIIWVHRGRPDIRAVRAALDGLAEGRMIAMAPEGRESLTGALEDGTNGAAFLAYKADVPILPIALAGTENSNIYNHLRQWRRPQVSVRVGKMFRLERQAGRRSEAVRIGTRKIMESLANLLPEEYRGIYRR